MFDHLSVGVRDLAAARAFYDAFLAPLGHSFTHANDAELGYGPVGLAAQLYLYPVAGERVAGLGTHIAFSADSRAAVDAAYAAALGAGATSVRPAGLHPDIAAGYYGAILYDPDGNKLEIVAGTMH
ncbi:VOC family protein [Phenylobacterium sp.]|uniref:VOC family protein n=1 Tax=Phenylobacterium sp. TaxID=1871053 RepID=UPI00121FED15|nr:VOC family protein [Phenylobacterium sp.]THD53719.1 MAG: VOC family protein [Phenylobacterium sp.]